MIESHLPLVRSIAKRYAGRGENLEDLVQVGSIGLIRASDRFDPDHGAAFATFAAPAIEGEIRRHLGDRTSALRVPRELKRKTGEVQRRRAELSSSLGRTPTVTELAAALELEPAEVERALETERALQPSAARVEDVAEAAGDSESLASSDDRLLVAAGAHVLDERERRIVLLRFHADMTEQDIATELGISQAHVSRLLSAALSKLRTELTHDGAARPAAGSKTRESEPISPELATTRRPGGNGKRQERDSPQPEATTKIERVGTRGKDRTKKSGHSGRFLVRMPSALHEKLTAEAEREQVSLNRFVTEALASAVSKTGRRSSARGAHSSPVAVGAPHHQRRRHLRMLLAANIAVIVAAAVVATVLLVLALERGI